MASWKSPGRAERVVVYEEGGEPRQYWRVEEEGAEVSWRSEQARAGEKVSGESLSTAELAKALEASLLERRRAGRGRKFRL